jgi:DNA topoisomerase-1
VVCEKPSAARRIAQALDDDSAPEGYRERGVPYYIARKSGEDLIIVSALGHLFTVAQDGGGWTYPVYNLRWVPVHEAEKKLARTMNFIRVIGKLALGVGGYISACDYDMEGSLIAYMVLLHVCGEESLRLAKRMRYSTLTDRDLKKAWDEMEETLDFPVIEAGRARHEIDWLFGVNLTRALTLSVKNTTGFYKTLSIGRVQGPTLKFIRDREVEIEAFLPIPFWVIKAETKIAGKRYPLEYETPQLNTKEEAEEVVKAIRGKDGVIEKIQIKQKEQTPFPPFSLGDLQREAYYKLRYSLTTTLRSAERLYLDALISYPRTSSQRLPPSIDLREILRGLQKREDYTKLAGMLLAKKELRPKQGRGDDPAHPAIHPTGKLPEKISRVDGRIYDLISRRFMAALGNPEVKENIDAYVEAGGYRFHLKGSRVLKKGWTIFYEPYTRKKEVVLPRLREKQVIPISRIETIRRYTKPPPRFNPSSLLKLMEDKEIGTKATRTDIIDTLLKRGYIEDRNIEVTDLGFTVVETLSRYCPEILSVELTRKLERDLDSIRTGEISADVVVERSKEVLEPVLSVFKEKEELIGSEIDGALRRETQRANILGKCPDCETGDIRIIRNKKTGKRFAGCSNYFEGLCDASYPLPQMGKIQATGKACPECGVPIIRLVRRGRRPWEFCLDFDCPTKKKVEKNGRQLQAIPSERR